MLACWHQPHGEPLRAICLEAIGILSGGKEGRLATANTAIKQHVLVSMHNEIEGGGLRCGLTVMGGRPLLRVVYLARRWRSTTVKEGGGGGGTGTHTINTRRKTSDRSTAARTARATWRRSATRS